MPSIFSLQYPEFAAQATLTGLLIISGYWFAALLQIVVLAYNIQQYRLGKHLVDVTEIFREIRPRRKSVTIKMVFYLLCWIWAVYRFIEVLVLALVTPSGRKAAKSILREAAASLHR